MGNNDKILSDELKKELLYEFTSKNRHGVYGFTQRVLAFNSNRIEGSTLTENQTADIFETGALSFDGAVIRAKDVEEATGHFSMFNFALQTIDQPLSEDLIKSFHYHLKSGVFEDMANGYPCGEYKNRKNIVGRITTALPGEVPEKMENLIYEYGRLSEVTLNDIADFHANFEEIHPFQDGNGRVGRMIVFREALTNGIIPPVIFDSDKSDYYQALIAAQKYSDPSLLRNFFAKEQEKYKEQIIGYLNPEKIPKIRPETDSEPPFPGGR